jgi:hypothetical protein
VREAHSQAGSLSQAGSHGPGEPTVESTQSGAPPAHSSGSAGS